MDKTDAGGTEAPFKDSAGETACGVLDAALAAINGDATLSPATRERLAARLQALQAGFCAGRRGCGGCDRAVACCQMVRMLFHANGIPPPCGDGT